MNFKQKAIAALEELKGDTTGIIAATIEDCQRVIGDIPEEVPTHTCKHCRKVFSMEGRSHNSLYCSPECRRHHGQKIYLEKYHARKAAMKEDDDDD